jgi:RNA polymerase sigma-70 factor (ECF subfamily)
MLAFQLATIEQAFSEHRGALVRHLAVLTRDSEVAQDLAQEAFLRLSREVAAGRVPDDAGAWLHQVGRNLAMSRGRHLQVVDRRAGNLPQPAEPQAPEHEAVQGELHAAVRVLLAGLPDDERLALLLAAEGYGGCEIADRVGRSPGATRTMLCRARAKLRARLASAGFSTA